MKKIKLFSIIFFISLTALLQAQAPLNSEITAEEIKYHVTYLASDELEGRMTGTEALYKAADYLKNEFERYGLKPFFGNYYFQEFPFTAGVELGNEVFMNIKTYDTSFDLKINEDFIPLTFTDNITLTGNLVFAGYGISADELDYNDYDKIDVKDKVVVVLRNHPEKKNPHSQFDKYSSLRFKTAVARDKGAKGIIFINDFEKDSDDLIEFRYDNASAIKGIVAVNVKRKIVEDIFSKNKTDLKSIIEKIDSTLTPDSFEIYNTLADAGIEVKRIEKKSVNVGAYIPAADANYSNEYLIIGAHFDHLGWGEFNSLYMGNEPKIHYGADDNASGTTGLLELAEKFVSEKDKLKRNIVFTAFSGEELGLLGSAYLVNNLPVPLENVITMLNMDMIGRINDNKDLIVHGTGTSSDWKDILNEKNSYNFNLSFNDEGFGSSDHSSFYAKQIPVLFFFTGTHSDYHKPTDTADKINAEGQAKILNFVYDVASEIIQKETRPNYVAVERKDRGRMNTSRVWVGTVPDFAGEVNGYKLGGVSEGSPAEKAGLEAGDIITSFGGKKISNLYDFTYAIGSFVPGDKVEVIVKRGDEEIKLKIELGSR